MSGRKAIDNFGGTVCLEVYAASAGNKTLPKGGRQK